MISMQLHAGMGQSTDTMQTSNNLPLRLFLCGDVMTGRGIDQVLPKSVEPTLYESYIQDARQYVTIAEQANGPIDKPVSYTYIWGDALDVWQEMAPDVKIVNLETSVTTHDEPWPGKGINYRMHPDNIKLLTEAGIDLCSLANNHTLDWGRQGLTETLTTLDQAGITYAGAGKNVSRAQEPAKHHTGKGSVVVLAYGTPSSGLPAEWQATKKKPGVNFLPRLDNEALQHVRKQVDAYSQPGTIVVVSIHWGGNWGYDVPENQQRFAHRLIDEAGVDVVHGHSSHHPKGIEIYRDKLILYGAGDLINDYEGISGHEEYRDDLTLMYFPSLHPQTGRLKSLTMVPMQIRNFQLHRASEQDAEWMAEALDSISNPFGTDIVLKDGLLRIGHR